MARITAPASRTRAEAEDACELIDVTYEELPALTDPETALDAAIWSALARSSSGFCSPSLIEYGTVVANTNNNVHVLKEVEK